MKQAGDNAMNSTPQIKVWDDFIRLFHWLTASAFIIAYATGDEILGLHVAAGYLIGILLIGRLIWGFIGSQHALFSDFVRSPTDALKYLQDALRLRARRYIGHNPAGGLMIVLLLVMLGAMTISGFVLYGIEENAGPLAAFVGDFGKGAEEAMEDLHEGLAALTLFLVGIHLCGVVFESIVHRENLVRAMITGYKRKTVTEPANDNSRHRHYLSN